MMKAMTTKVVITPALTMVMTTMTIEKKRPMGEEIECYSTGVMCRVWLRRATYKVPLLALAKVPENANVAQTLAPGVYVAANDWPASQCRC